MSHQSLICHLSISKTNSKYIKDYDKNKKLIYLQYQDVNNLFGWAMSQKILVNSFERITKTFQFKEDFTKNYKKESDEGYFLEDDVQHTEK